ncbi:hypothetical protein [Streptomyces sp. URMC 124]|uniref:hypothetical protein n=1 Tax=Streptomyces sp. URMC 124 TaxID=3423405 RepID=UPI003F1ADC12
MARNGTSQGFAWFMIAVTAVLTSGVAADWAAGEGFDWTTTAWVLFLWPQALRDLLRARGRRRAAARAEVLGNWAPFLSTALLWVGLVLGWRRGEGTDWFALAGALLLPAAGLLWLAAKLVGGRPRRA